jgi:hypothetical protein
LKQGPAGGGGFDCFIAAHQVDPRGRVIGEICEMLEQEFV